MWEHAQAVQERRGVRIETALKWIDANQPSQVIPSNGLDTFPPDPPNTFNIIRKSWSWEELARIGAAESNHAKRLEYSDMRPPDARQILDSSGRSWSWEELAHIRLRISSDQMSPTQISLVEFNSSSGSSPTAAWPNAHELGHFRGL